MLEFISANAVPGATSAVDAPVVGYSIAYPVGVVGVIAALFLAQRVWKVDYAQEIASYREAPATGEELLFSSPLPPDEREPGAPMAPVAGEPGTNGA